MDIWIMDKDFSSRIFNTFKFFVSTFVLLLLVDSLFPSPPGPKERTRMKDVNK